MAHPKLLAQICNQESEALQDKRHVVFSRLRGRRRLALFLEEAIDGGFSVRS